MIRDIVKDPIFLSRKSTPATRDDRAVITDLADTLRANADHCVGMAANMIGAAKTILIAQVGDKPEVLVNPQITDHSRQTYQAEEGCLSLTGTRAVTRYERITVDYLDRGFKRRTKTFSGYAAQIIQHEMDHFEGKLI